MLSWWLRLLFHLFFYMQGFKQGKSSLHLTYTPVYGLQTSSMSKCAKKQKNNCSLANQSENKTNHNRIYFKMEKISQTKNSIQTSFLMQGEKILRPKPTTPPLYNLHKIPFIYIIVLVLRCLTLYPDRALGKVNL